MLYSRDGKAQLLVGAFENDEQTTIAAYRDYVLRENYPGAALDYAPVHDRWFVLSGTIGDKEFYERVSFTCGGRLINSWAMIYPKAENRFYDRVVEAVARTYYARRRTLWQLRLRAGIHPGLCQSLPSSASRRAPTAPCISATRSRR